MDYRSIIESKYNRSNWQSLLYDIFRQKVQFWQQPQSVSVDESMAKCALYIGKITLPDGHIIAIYEVELSDSVVIERNRAGIRNLLCTNWRGMGCSGAFMFCFRHDETVLRFSYVSESFVFTEDGSITKERTDTKRFTYLLGEGHRSRTAIKQFEDLKKSSLDLKAITKAFSVEALSELFFKEYKKQYEDIIEFITGKRMVKVANKWEEQITGQPCREIMQEFVQFPDAEKAVRDYVKKLMGRLVFIQFLQKKGWMGCSAGESWNDGDKEFIQNLFVKTSHKNTFVDDVLEPLFNDINTKRIGDIASSPNVGVGIKIPYLNGGLFEKDEYDKTRFLLPAEFMKKLLDFFASYNFTIDENDPDDAEIGVDPEMLGRIFENLLEDNKDKGAFYTPKEIVLYMCRESLIAYLQTDVKDDAIKQSIRQFVSTYNETVLSEELKETIDQKLKDVKICDPAIGSGAFPMGLLKELYACRKAIEGIDDDAAVSIKTHIIQNNIYGVDIEKGAVDIARLRFWLALIVDEKDPHALPNMDFKIMQGNSLLEQYEGVELSGMSIDEQKKRKTKKDQLWQATLAFDEKYALDNIQRAIKEYYLTNDYHSKLSLRSIINENVRNYIINLKGCTPDVKSKIEKLPIPNDKFFLWHIYFKEVFDKGGFDIVIANPPYVQLSKQPNVSESYKKTLKDTFGTSGGRLNLFIFMLHHAINITNKYGVITFIIPNTILTQEYYKDTRELLLKHHLHTIVNYNDMEFDNAVVENVTLIVTKDTPKENDVHVYSCKGKEVEYVKTISTLKFKKQKGFVFNINSNDFIDKLFEDTTPLSELCNINQAIALKGDKSLSVKHEYSSGYYKFLDGRNIGRYSITWSGLYLDYDLERIHSCKRKDIFECKEKLFFRRVSANLMATYDDSQYFALNTLVVITPKKNCDIKFILALFNSNLMNYIYKNKFKSTKTVFSEIQARSVGELPIKECSKYKVGIVTIVDRILAAKKANPLTDTSELEQEIDRLVYELYGLTYDEVLIVDPETPITRKEYEISYE